MRKTIIKITQGNKVEFWSSIKEISVNKQWVNYHSIKGRKFPYLYKKVKFEKINYFDSGMSLQEYYDFLQGKRTNEIQIKKK